MVFSVFLFAGVSVIASSISFYNNTDVKKSDNQEKKNKVTAASKKGESDKTIKDIYLQEKQNPDRVLAINPENTNSIYQYRKDQSGKLYPENKFFSGKTNRRNNILTVSPNDGSDAKKINLKINSDNSIEDMSSKEKYKNISKKSLLPSQNKNPEADHLKTTTSKGQPQIDPKFYDPNAEPDGPNVAYEVGYRQFYNPITHMYYGDGDEYKTYDPKSLNIDDYRDSNDVMSAVSNSQTSISDERIQELKDFDYAVNFPHQLN